MAFLNRSFEYDAVDHDNDEVDADDAEYDDEVQDHAQIAVKEDSSTAPGLSTIRNKARSDTTPSGDEQELGVTGVCVAARKQSRPPGVRLGYHAAFTGTLAAFWIGITIAAGVIRGKFVAECEPLDVFGLLGVCIFTFMALRCTCATALLAVAGWRMRGTAPSRLDSAGRGTVLMGEEVARFQHARAMVQAMPLKPFNPATDMRILDDDDDDRPPKARITSGAARRTTWCTTIRISLAIDIVPVFSLVFFVFLGTEIPIYDPIVPFSPWCQTSLIFNWASMTVLILHVVCTLVPLYYNLMSQRPCATPSK